MSKIISGVYMIKNKVNNKVYIGSSKNIKKRLQEHKRLLRLNNHYNIKLQRAWCKYGEENFETSILETTSSDRESLLFTEQKYIDSNKDGYNINKRAEGPTGMKNDFFIKYNREIKSKKVYQYTIEGKFLKEWYNISDAARFYKCNLGSINSVCKKETKTLFGFVWRFKDDIFDKNKIIPYNEIKNSCIKSVLQYSLDGLFIKEWNSISQASNELKINTSSICMCCKEVRKFAGNFIWRYKIDDNICDKINFCNKKKPNSKKVIQINSNNHEIKKWDSIKEASDFFNIDRKKISRACVNNKMCNGYYWKYSK